MPNDQTRFDSPGTTLGWVVACVVLALGCGPLDKRKPESQVEVPVQVGVLPDAAEATLRSLYAPLFAYLAPATGLAFELHVPNDYDALLDMLDEGALDLVWLGGLTFSHAHERSNARLLVSRDTDVRFTSIFVAASDAEGATLGAFAGKPLAFGPRLSTSGHLMPRVFLESQGVRVERFFSEVRHSAGHDETMEWVRDGVVAIGAVNSQIAQAMFRTGVVGEDEVRIIATTPPYQNYAWATRGTLDPDVRAALLQAFLALDPAVPEHAALLGEFGAGGFVPVGPEAYDTLRQVARNNGLLERPR